MSPKTLVLADYGLALGAFALANVSAMVTVVWLIPGFVYLEAAAWILLAMVAIWLSAVTRSSRTALTSITKNWWVFPFFVFAGLSSFWSIFWQVSLARWLVLTCTLIVGAVIGVRLAVWRVVRALAIFGLAILLLSLCLVWLAPRFGIMNYYIIQGAWRGLYWHKNHMGLISAFFALIFLFEAMRAYRNRGGRVWLWGLLYVLAIAFTYKTSSAAAWLVLVLLHAALALFAAYLKLRIRLRWFHYVVLASSALLAACLGFANLDRVLGLVNRNSTLTGRVPMWLDLFRVYLSGRPLAGYGFNAFWYDDVHRLTMQRLAGYPDRIVIADNGFIDILMNTGLLGLALFMLLYVGIWFRTVRTALRVPSLQTLVGPTIMAFTLVANMSWSLLFENENFFMLLIVIVGVGLTGPPAGQAESTPAV